MPGLGLMLVLYGKGKHDGDGENYVSCRDHPISDSLSYVKLWNQSQLLTEDLLKSATASMSKQKAVFENVD